MTNELTSDLLWFAAGRLEEIANESSTTVKEALLVEGLKKNGRMEWLLRAAYDPFITYGLTSAGFELPVKSGTDVNLDNSVIAVLDALKNRVFTGSAAREAVDAVLLEAPTPVAKLMLNIIDKDLRAGISVKTINKALKRVSKEPIFVFEVMLAHKFDQSRLTDFPVYVEPKLDGVRAICIWKGPEDVTVCSRTGKPLVGANSLIDPINVWMNHWNTESKPYVLDGELIFGNFNSTVSAARSSGGGEVMYHVFDLMPVSEFIGKEKLPYRMRRNRLASVTSGSGMPSCLTLVPSYVVNSETEIHSIYGRVRETGGEGVIVKDRNGIYEAKRSYAWMKIKGEETLDLKVVDYLEGTGKYVEKLGAFVVEHRGVRVNVGTGFDDVQRDHLWKMRDALVGKIMEVQFHEVTPDNSLRHPRFVRFRDDKETPDA